MSACTCAKAAALDFDVLVDIYFSFLEGGTSPSGRAAWSQRGPSGRASLRNPHKDVPAPIVDSAPEREKSTGRASIGVKVAEGRGGGQGLPLPDPNPSPTSNRAGSCRAPSPAVLYE